MRLTGEREQRFTEIGQKNIWTIDLDMEGSYLREILLTFISPDGGFRWKRRGFVN